LGFTERKTGKRYTENAAIGKSILFPNSQKRITIQSQTSEYNFRGSPIGEAFIGIIEEDGKETEEIVLSPRFPSFDKMRKGEWVVDIPEHEHRYYTGLQVTKDPGVLAVYAGFILMIAGCFITFFISHQKLYIEVTDDGNSSRIRLFGSANKNKIGMKKKIEKISSQLSNLS
jgi:cytochrome c biogenesis protein